MSRTYTVTLEFEVKMTSPGAPASGPSFSGPGEPAEPPELEIESCGFEGAGEYLETLYKKYKAEKESRNVPPDSFDQFFADKIYEKVHDQAYEDDWSEDADDYDPTE